MAIYDLFILQNGIRMRDKISHGDFVSDHISLNYSKACDLLVLLIIDTLYYFQMDTEIKNEEINIIIDEKKENNKNLIQSIQNYLENYETQFHPKSFILKNGQKLLVDMYATYYSYKQIMIQNQQFFPEEVVLEFNETKDSLGGVPFTTLFQTTTHPPSENSQYIPILIPQAFQPSYFYEQLTKEELVDTVSVQFRKIVLPRLYGSPLQIRFYNACARILWLCSNKITNSLNSYTMNLINSCLVSSSPSPSPSSSPPSLNFDLTNKIETIEKEILSSVNHNPKENNTNNNLNDENNNKNFEILGAVNSKFFFFFFFKYF